jgi:catechol 2,3-dioxygenase-like lactoylglutathione lyase family enzyme
MASELVALGWDANDPRRLAWFWAQALRWGVGDDARGEISLVPSDGTTFQILFVPVPEPKSSQNRIHLDLTTTSIEDQRGTVARLIEAGAHHVDVGQSPEEPHVVLADPEGNEFCIIQPENTFLAGCERLGAINCDGTRAVGYFWSEVLGWPLVWDQDEETAIRAPDGAGPLITWSGPPLMPKLGKNRLHLHIGPTAGGDQQATIDRLISFGATRIDAAPGHGERVVMADPDGNEFCVVASAGSRSSTTTSSPHTSSRPH